MLDNPKELVVPDKTFRVVLQNLQEGDLEQVRAHAGRQAGFKSVLTDVGTVRAELTFTFNGSDADAAAAEILKFANARGL